MCQLSLIWINILIVGSNLYSNVVNSFVPIAKINLPLSSSSSSGTKGQWISLYSQPGDGSSKNTENVVDDNISEDSVDSQFKALDGIEEIVAEGEAALQDAEAALTAAAMEERVTIESNILLETDVGKKSDVSSKDDGLSVTKDVPTSKNVFNNFAGAKKKPKNPEMDEKLKEIRKVAIASAVGGLAVGSLSGLALDIYLLNEGLDLDVEPALPPGIFGVVLGTTGYILGMQDNKVGGIVRTVLGGAATSIADASKSLISKLISKITNEVTAIPKKVESAVQQKAQETVEEINKIPSKVKDSATNAAKRTADEISKIPGQVKDAATSATEKAVEEIKATPGKIVEGTKQAVVRTVDEIEDIVIEAVDDVKEKVDEVVSLPGKKLDEISGRVSQIVPVDKSIDKEVQPKVPKPPQTTPPPILDQDENKSTKEDKPTFSLPTINVPTPPKLPPMESVQIKIPEINLPKRPEGQAEKTEKKSDIVPPVSKSLNKSSGTKTVEETPSEAKKPSDESFTFNEISLKKIVKDIKQDTSGALVEDEEDRKLMASLFERKEKEAQDEKAAIALASEKKKAEEKKKAQIAAEQARRRKEEKVREERAAALALSAEKKKAEEEKRAQIAAEARQRKEEKAKEERAAAMALAAERKRKAEEKKRTQIAAKESKLRKKESEQMTKNIRVQETDSKSSPTISLGFGRFKSKTKEIKTPSFIGSKSPKAPPRVPILSEWRENKDGSITGFISRSESFEDGESITTSPIVSKVVGGAVVQTNSGSRYYLEKQTKAQAPTKKTINLEANSLEKRATALAAAAEAQKMAAEERKAAQLAAAESRKRKEQERKDAILAANEEKKRKNAEIRAAALAAAEAKKAKAEEKRAAALAAVEARKKEAAEKRAAALALAEARKKEAAEKRAAAAKESKDVVEDSKPGATISLGFLFGFGQQETAETQKESPLPTRQVVKRVSSAPRGVPTIYNWRQNRNGSITGLISGSKSFQDGESVTTSPITSDATGGTVVATSSGSKYYLESVENSKAKAAKVAAARKVAAEEKRQKLAEEKRIAAEAIRQKAELKKNARKVVQPQKRTGRTISLNNADKSGFKMGVNKATSRVSSKKAPRGVPSILRWRQNRDGSISGFISGSTSFEDGERITTSKITSGNIEKGSVVKTGSGSSYFLD